MALLLLLILFSAARPIVAPPSMLLPNSTTVSASWNGASNKSVLASVTSTSPEQQEIKDLGYYFVDFKNKSLSSYCLNVQESGYLSWKTTETQTTSVVTCTQNVTDSSCDNPGTYTRTYPPQYTPTFKPPCCGQCVIQASKAHALYWPTPAPQPAISTLVDADGFTFTSPSVYIIYEHLAATDFCGHPGSIMSNATVPLQQWQVSSVAPGATLTAVNFADLTNCSRNKPGSNTNAYEGAYDRCFPTLQYDISYLSTLQPAWATCVPVGGWVWDPPHAFTSVSSLNGVDSHNLDPKVASFSLTKPSSPSLTNLISPGAHISSTPPMTKPPTDPPLPKQTPVDPPRQTPPTDHAHNAPSDAAIQSPADFAGPADPHTNLNNAPSDPAIQSPADPADPTDPRTKLNNAVAVGQGAHGPMSGPQNAATASTTSVSQDPAVAVANKADTPTASTPDIFQTKDSSKDPAVDPSNPRASYPLQPIVVGDETITVPNSRVAELKVGSQTLNVQNPVITISNTPISLASDKLQIGTKAHIFVSLTPTPAGNLFAIGPESFTLNSQDVVTDGTQISVDGPKVTVDGTQVSLEPSELVVGGGTETSALATGNTLVEVDGEKGRTGAGVQAGTQGDVEPSAGTNASLRSSPMSSLGAVGGGAATPSNGSAPAASGMAAAPFLGTASKVGDRVNLWVSVGSWFWVVGCLIGV